MTGTTENIKNQYRAIEAVKAITEHTSIVLGRPLYYHVTTFGCQMNAHDSEKLRGILEEMGYVETDTEDCDFVIYNTCTVRENADKKIYGRLGRLNGFKKKNPHMMIGLCGCMMQQKEVVEKIKKSYPFVDLIFGTHNLSEFAVLTRKVFEDNSAVVKLLDGDNSGLLESLPSKRKYSFKSGVNIMYGCNNFCTYCIVPYVRGREYSRSPEDIMDEVKRLGDDGVIEIMLLGQNVNSYGKTLDNPISFAELLRRVEEIDAIKRIRFMTSHPKDLSDELIDVMASSKKICTHLHLPLQSGSTELLKRMNRHYTKESYIDLAEKIRERIPDIALTTDIIVGFPGESEKDFEETMEVVDRIGYDSAFTFIYSKRTGTPAATMPDQVPEDVCHKRFDRLLELVQRKARERALRLEGKTLPVLIEEKNREKGLVTGRLSNNSTVHVRAGEENIGKIVNVSLKECKGFYYIGDLAD